MKNLYATRLFVLTLGFLLAGLGMKAQQVTVTNQYLYYSGLYNPARMGADTLNRVYFSYQQRRANFGSQSNSQVLSFNTAPFGLKQNMGAGIFLSNDRSHTRYKINANAAYSFGIYGKYTRLSFGASVGAIIMGYDFSEVPVYDRRDPVLGAAPNFTELDATFGTEFSYGKKNSELLLGASASQLPSEFTPQDSFSVHLQPHLFGHVSFLTRVKGDIYIGPIALYKNTITEGLSLGDGILDVGTKVEFRNRNLWFAGGYRLLQAGAHAALGLRIIDNRDSTEKRGDYAQRLALFGNFEMPLTETDVFGPTFEIGLTYDFGQLGKGPQSRIDTVYQERDPGPFWENTGNANWYLEKKMGDSRPEGLIAKSDNGREFVTMTYDYNDDVFEYNLEDLPEVDAMVDHIVSDIMVEAFDPESDEWASLASAEFISLTAKLSYDTTAMNDLTNIEYKGEFGSEFSQTYYLEGLFERKVSFSEGEYLNNLQLAVLKMLAIKDVLEMRLDLDSPIDISISPDNRNLGTFQKNNITIRFKHHRRR